MQNLFKTGQSDDKTFVQQSNSVALLCFPVLSIAKFLKNNLDNINGI